MRIIVLIGVVGILLACGRSQQPDEKETAPSASPTPTATALVPERNEQPVPQSGERVAVPEQEGQAPQASERTDEPQPNTQPGQVDQPGDIIPSAAHSSILMISGEFGLNERVFDAEVIARAKLKSTAAAAESVRVDSNGTAIYRSLLEFRFEALEYIKGTGGSELIVQAHNWSDLERKTYSTMELAQDAAKSWVRDRDTRWDDREALIMLVEKAAVPGASAQSKRYSFGPHGFIEAYALDSGYKAWLPSASSGVTAGSSSDGLRYLLEVPGAGSSGVASALPETISVSEMKALIAKLEKWRKDGEGVDSYLECIRESFREDRYINEYKERGESFNVSFDHYLGSGLATETVVYDGRPWAGKVWFEGRDKELFANKNGDFIALRPLPARTYLIYHNFQWEKLIPCNYYPNEYKNTYSWYVHVTAPAGTLHEAFFDPVTVGSAIAADASNGVLKPTAFTDGNSSSATIQRIAWEAPSTGSGQAGTVKLKLTPHTGLANHVIDFIALDGTVSLSLDADEATVDSVNNTLSWPVTHQPWKEGDKLMLRIHDGP